MQTQTFDEITRSFASRSSRRKLLRGMVGGTIAAIGLRAGASARAEKVDICHYDADTGTYHHINVSVNALDAHLSHGDLVACDENLELDFSSCTCVCGITAADCETGTTFNDATCACDPAPTNACTGLEFGEQCGSASTQFCAFSVEASELVCIDSVSAGSSPDDNGCQSDAECDTAGEVCVDDGNPQNHCHGLVT